MLQETSKSLSFNFVWLRAGSAAHAQIEDGILQM